MSLRAGRAWTEEDNLARMGIGSREATLLGGYEALVAEATPELLSRLKPLAAPVVVVEKVAADATIMALVNSFLTPHKEFGLRLTAKELGHVTVVAATHGSGISRIARRMGKSTMRWDRLAAKHVGTRAYDRNGNALENHDTVFRKVARVVVRKMTEDPIQTIRCILTHERPDLIVAALQRQGYTSHWIMYTPDRVLQAQLIAKRNLAAGLLRYMHNTWNDLLLLRGYVDEIEDEEQLIQVVKTPIISV